MIILHTYLDLLLGKFPLYLDKYNHNIPSAKGEINILQESVNDQGIVRIIKMLRTVNIEQ